MAAITACCKPQTGATRVIPGTTAGSQPTVVSSREVNVENENDPGGDFAVEGQPLGEAYVVWQTLRHFE